MCYIVTESVFRLHSKNNYVALSLDLKGHNASLYTLSVCLDGKAANLPISYNSYEITESSNFAKGNAFDFINNDLSAKL